MESQDRFVNDVEAAKILSVSPQTLRNWRHIGRGPSYTKRGRMVRYQIQSLLAYMEGGRIEPEARDDQR
jgi:predicted site-specific integrase-resolvase